MSKTVGIVGAGITGLTAARYLTLRGFDVTLLEAGGHAGGYMHSTAEAGWLVENGPNTLAADADTVTLLKELGAGDVVEASPAAKKRFLVLGGKPVALPSSPPALLKSNLFSWRAKAALLREPWVGPADPQKEETVAEFTRRRLGAEWLEKAVGPFVSGIYAGDPERLSLRAAFPRMYALERDQGGLIRGAMKSGKMNARKLYSGTAGLGSIAAQLAAGLPNLRLNTDVTSIEPNAGGWTVYSGAGARTFDHLLLTGSAPRTAALVANLLPGLAARLSTVNHAAVTVVHHGYRRDDVGHPVDGFGMLFPRGAGFRSLGTLFPSTMFEGRTPPGHVLLTTFAGGMLDPELTALPPAEAEAIVVREHAGLLNIRAQPVWTRVFRVKEAIPQYHVGHGAITNAVTEAEREHTGLYLRGSFTGGVALADRIHAGVEAAKQIILTQVPS